MRIWGGVRGAAGWCGWLPSRGWCAAVLAVVVGSAPLGTPAHAPAAVCYRVTRTIGVGWYPTAVAVDSGTRTVYVANTRDSSVSVIDAATGTVTRTIQVGHLLTSGVAVDPGTRTAYVTSNDGGLVAVIDEATGTVTRTISVLGFPGGVAVDPATHAAYVTGGLDDWVSVISRARC